MRFLISVDGLLSRPEHPQGQLASVQISGGSLRRTGLGTFGVPYFGHGALDIEKADAMRTFAHAIAQEHPAMLAAGVGTSVPYFTRADTKGNKGSQVIAGPPPSGRVVG